MDSNLDLPQWMKDTKGGKRTSAYSAPAAKKRKTKKTSPTEGNVTTGGMIKKGKRKAYLDSL
jgi:hypothetical protein